MGVYTCETCNTKFTRKPEFLKHTCTFVNILQESNLFVNQMRPTVPITKPFIKWVGGKTQILDKLLVEFPTEISNYHEIFLGGGSVLFALLSYVKHGIINISGTIYAYDANGPLIYVYKNMQMNHTDLYNKLQILITDYNSCSDIDTNHVLKINRNPATIDEAKLAKENYYYWIRSKYNRLNHDEKKTTVGSAMFIFLNKTCFRGIFRVGPNGFNVPYGHYRNPEICNKPHFDEIHELIHGVVFECCDFADSIVRMREGDYVYVDPPYAPETQTSFVGYTENGFNLEEHARLFGLLHGLTAKKCKMLLSNADVELVRENFMDEKYKIQSILCKRAIHSKNPDAKSREVIIKNY